MSNPDSRPVYLNLLKIRQPATALLSIGHRISGVLLFLSLPLVLYLFHYSLRGADEYAAVQGWLGSPALAIASVLLAGMLLLHFLAGVRFLLIDVDVGAKRRPARTTAVLVLGAAPAFTLLLAVLVLW